MINLAAKEPSYHQQYSCLIKVSVIIFVITSQIQAQTWTGCTVNTVEATVNDVAGLSSLEETAD